MRSSWRTTGGDHPQARSGPRWSTFYEETIRTAFHDLLHLEVRVEKSDNQVVLRFRTFATGERVKYRPG